MKLLITILTMIFNSLGASAETIWKNYSKNDEMTGEESVYIYTKSAKSTRPMSFPYNKTSSFIALMCTKKNKSIDFSFLFSIAPNVNNKEIIIKNFD